MSKVVSVGEIVWDVFESGKRLGGAPVNFAFFAKEYGAVALPVSAVGNDVLGDETLAALGASGLETDLIQRNGLPTSRVLVTMDAAGVPEYEIVENVAWDALCCDARTLAACSNADVICWGTLAQRSPVSHGSIMEMISAAPASCLKVYDINLRQHYYSAEVVRQSLEKADVLKLNEDELPVVAGMFSLGGDPGSQIGTLVEMFSLENVIYTHGAEYSEVYGPQGLLSHLPTPGVRVADTVGAGDSFTAAYVMARLDGMSAGDAHRRAVEVAAYVCTCRGAINPLPSSLL